MSSLSSDQIKDLISKALSSENNPQRKFHQSVQMYIKLREVDLSKPENRFSLLVQLPHVNEKITKSVCVLTAGSLLSQARSLGIDVISRDELEPLAGNKKMARKLARKYDYFIAEAPLMALVGRVLGQFLAPRDKMPTPVPPNSDISPHVSRLRSSVQIRLKTQGVMSAVIGTEDMPIEHLVENATRILSTVEERLPGGRRNMKSLHFKTTMGKKATLEVGKHG